MVGTMRPERMERLVRDHLAREGLADKVELIVHDAYPPAKTRLGGNPAAEALLRTYRDLGHEPEIWPHLAGSAPFYLITEMLHIPTALGGLGHGGRAHSPNEYATLEGIEAYEKSVAAFLLNLAGTL
jgi:acetylornithine deacetylase/succinyl-diaminopimelate desuccinylase-like protein